MDKKLKRGAQLGIQLVVVIMMLLATFIVWKFGVLDKVVGIIGSVGYQIDTTNLDICQGIGEKRKGTSFVGSELTDMDYDDLPDYICDPCVCRDGYGRSMWDDGKCKIFADAGYDLDSIGMMLAWEVAGYESSSAESIQKNMKCLHDKSAYSENNFCSTNNMNIETSDTDNDFLPDVCDDDPNNFNQGKNLNCYNGPIQLHADRQDSLTFGVVYSQKLENGLMEKTKQCVFSICSPLNNYIVTERIYHRYCPNQYCSGCKPEENSIFSSYKLPKDGQRDNNNGCYCVGNDRYKDQYVICENNGKRDSADGKPLCNH